MGYRRLQINHGKYNKSKGRVELDRVEEVGPIEVTMPKASFGPLYRQRKEILSGQRSAFRSESKKDPGNSSYYRELQNCSRALVREMDKGWDNGDGTISFVVPAHSWERFDREDLFDEVPGVSFRFMNYGESRHKLI